MPTEPLRDMGCEFRVGLQRDALDCSRGSGCDLPQMMPMDPKVKPKRRYVRSFVSIQMVTGPSLTSETRMSAPNSPVSTGRSRSRRLRANCR